MASLSLPLVLIKGAGDLASGVALRLHRAGFPVILTELAQPTAVRRTVCFAQAVYDGACQVEGVTARRATAGEVAELLADGLLPVLVDPSAGVAQELGAHVLVDAIVAKRNSGTHRSDAPLVIALGPGFVAGDDPGADVHAVIETHRGHTLGRVIWYGGALPNTGIPGEVAGAAPQGATASRVLRAEMAGRLTPLAEIGDRLAMGQMIARIEDTDGGRAEVRAPFDGILRGLIHPLAPITPGLKIGDVDARADEAACFTVSDKALAIAGGVLEAILSALTRRSLRVSAPP
jgi:xanthine dehydrogenase accessory factor